MRINLWTHYSDTYWQQKQKVFSEEIRKNSVLFNLFLATKLFSPFLLRETAVKRFDIKVLSQAVVALSTFAIAWGPGIIDQTQEKCSTLVCIWYEGVTRRTVSLVRTANLKNLLFRKRAKEQNRVEFPSMLPAPCFSLLATSYLVVRIWILYYE